MVGFELSRAVTRPSPLAPSRPQENRPNSLFWKILPINLWGSRFCGPFPKRNHCFQDFSKGRGRGVASFLLIPFLLLPILAAAQYTTATLSGIITDSSGRTVPGARVTVENTGTGLIRAYTTGEDGAYLFPALPVGTYHLQVEKEGFSRYSHRALHSMSMKQRRSLYPYASAR